MMASSYINLGHGVLIPTFRLRHDTYHKDADIEKDPEILYERFVYENRLHIKENEMEALQVVSN